MKNLIIFGPPGSGKGTQAVRLAEKFNLLHTSTGYLLREEITNQTTLGLKAKSFIDVGKLVPDEVVIGMLNEKIEENKHANGFIFDGFPRTVAQAETLDNLLDEKGTDIFILLSLDVNEEELKRRILHRGKTSGRSDDTDEHIINKRIKEYEEKTAPVAEYYNKQSKLHVVKGEGSIDETFALLCEVMEA